MAELDGFIVLLGVVIFVILAIYYLCTRTSSSDVRNKDYVYTSSSTAGYAWNESKGLEPYTLDLHNYSLAQAEREVPKFLQRRISEYNSGGSGVTFIITGRGNHSDGGPKIKPMVDKYLRDNGFNYNWEDHGGRVRIYL